MEGDGARQSLLMTYINERGETQGVPIQDASASVMRVAMNMVSDLANKEAQALVGRVGRETAIKVLAGIEPSQSLGLDNARNPS